jgi:hypothetical protein
MTAEEILARLVELARRIEEHKAAAYVLELERLELQGKLRAAAWTPPDPPVKSS